MSLTEKKDVLLIILAEIDSFCKDNNINYYLIGGTLIGAIRHNGFIPWDDDIDIGMMRDDYEKFMSNYSSESNRTKAIDFRNFKHYIWPAGKVIHTDTLLYENNYTKASIGVNVDVFPWDVAPGSLDSAKKHCRKINIYRDILTLKHLTVSKKRGFAKNALVVMGKILYVVPDKWLLSRIHNLSCQYKDQDSKYVCNFSGAWKEKEIVNKYIFSSSLLHNFEGKLYPIPSGYDEFLTCIYGDYMKLPPKEKQVTHHGSVSYWKD